MTEGNGRRTQFWMTSHDGVNIYLRDALHNRYVHTHGNDGHPQDGRELIFWDHEYGRRIQISLESVPDEEEEATSLRAVGRWEALGFIPSGGRSKQVTIGTDMTNSHGSSESFSSSVSASVSVGFECFGASMSAEVATSVGRDMAQSRDFAESTHESQTESMTFERVDGGVYLWQWTFAFDTGDGTPVQGSTMTNKFAQTEGRWERPACLPGYARDDISGYQDCVSERYRITYDA